MELILPLLVGIVILHFVCGDRFHGNDVTIRPKKHNAVFTSQILNMAALNQSGKNVIISPLSIELIAAMLMAGTGGRTQEQIKTNFFKFPASDRYDINEYGGNLMLLPKTNNDKFHKNVSALYYGHHFINNVRFPAKQDYMSLVKKYFKSNLMDTDFTKERETARFNYLINDMVKRETKGRVINFPPIDAINKHIVAMLVNAVYLKTAWKSSNQILLAYHNKIMIAFKLPFQNGDLNMYIISPKKGVTNDTMHQSYGPRGAIGFLLDNQKLFDSVPRPNSSSMPQFYMEFNVELQDIFRQLAVNDAFSPETANFEYMLGKSDAADKPRVSKIIHKSFVQVDQKGIEFGSANAIEIENISNVPRNSNDNGKFQEKLKPINQFLFYLTAQHKTTRYEYESIIFAGQKVAA